MEVAVFRNLGAQYRGAKFEGRMAWAVQATSGPNKGKTFDTVDGLILRDVRFEVNTAARERVVRAKKKTPHAYVVGEVVKIFPLGTLPKKADGESLAPGRGAIVPVSYNPFIAGHFFRLDTGKGVSSSPLVVMAPQGVYAAKPAALRGLFGLGAIREVGAMDWRDAPVDGWNG